MIDPADWEAEQRMLARYEPDDGREEAPTRCVCCNVMLIGNAVPYCDPCNTDTHSHHWEDER